MKNYESPVVVATEELAEGVYAASGAVAGANTSTDCWTVEAVSVQDWNGWAHVFEVRCKHSTAVQHISSETEVTLTMSNLVTYACAETDGFETTYSGSTIVVKRPLHANAYNSGDSVTYKVMVQCADEGTTKGISCTKSTIKCTHKTNVQGVLD